MSKFKVGDVVRVEFEVRKVDLRNGPVGYYGEINGCTQYLTEDQLTLVSRPEPKKYQVLYSYIGAPLNRISTTLYESKEDWDESDALGQFIALLDDDGKWVEG